MTKNHNVFMVDQVIDYTTLKIEDFTVTQWIPIPKPFVL
jgi:hypothetical protein